MDIPGLLQSHFGLEAEEIKTLEGYGSSNFQIDTTEGRYVLKCYEDTTSRQGLLAVESKVLAALANLSPYYFPVVMTGLRKEDIVRSDGKIFRLHKFVYGDFLAEVPHTNLLLQSFGRLLGEMDVKMGLIDPHQLGIREIQWDLRHFLDNRELLSYIEQPEKRSLADYFFLQYEEQVLPIAHTLRKSLIHNDANDWNVLTKNGLVTGIIDFGDMCYSWLINELAVAITYVMMGKDDPLEAASQVISGYQSVQKMYKEELDILYYLVAARLCTSVCNSAYSKTQIPDSDYITISEKPAWALLDKWISINPLRVAQKFRQAAGYAAIKFPSRDQQIKRRNAVLSKSLSVSYQEPIQMYRSAFQYMYDTEGNTYLDAYNNIMLAGHSHPYIVRAGQQTLARLNTNTRYLYDEILSYSERLLKTFPKTLNKIFLLNSGSSATDLAIRLSRSFNSREKIAVLEHGYHGNTQIGIGISHYKYSDKQGIGKPESVIELPLPKAFGSGYSDNGSAGAYFAEQAIALLKPYEQEIAAFIAEPIVGCGGQVPLAKNYLKDIYPVIRQQGGVCISDETQVGFGRLGRHFWGFEMHGVVPDIVILGKPMGNGHPIGAVITTEHIAEKFEQGPEFFSSFGGNPVSCAIGQAVLEVIEREDLQRKAQEVGDYLCERLRELQSQFKCLADVRGTGLFIGVEFQDHKGGPGTQLASRIKNQLRQEHILVSTDGPFEEVIKIKPPLYFNREDADILCAAMHGILAREWP
ncbi:aminotransferase class III-fold pyridoxal phosphate-dependent enzyme [Lentiprolixibacter aurantiacus]|uniref:Aminotransferase class III-fold pyridoxal phosphate-dependent enzyme n=1 Tax=Lentiprolixibacter aurantiacus TaxID=2993939 RepID=A0AAE3SNI9_9FLAO|nr:aminotransferase class III-fold pyridoxal phosphate-dependent enzyme [Lentiprolixibacter aurantiacus]MCX2719684.1 aminotransferase class III-fold pyridoxal phosphate-dependent enzyme [Lentiprolixibacter aurantiacus]